MKKIITVFFTLLLVIFTASCSTENTVECDEGYILVENDCVLDETDTPIDQPLVCDEGYIEENGECVLEEPEEEEETHKMFEIKGDQRVYFNVPYKRVDGVTQYLDIYYPDEIKEDMPVFMYVHGGGFLWGNKDLVNETFRINHVSYKDRLNELGYVFISVGYQKQKNLTYPCLEGQISDIKDAIKWVKLNYTDLSTSDENIGLWGLSAGGALALAAALNPDENYQSYYPDISSDVKYVIDFYGITDIYDFYNFANYGNLSEQDLATEHWRVNTHINMSSETEENHLQIKQYVDLHSPLYNYEKTNVKISIHHGDSDNVVSFEENAKALFDKGIALKNGIILTRYEGKDHGFWWDTPAFYEELLEKVISEVLLFSSID